MNTMPLILLSQLFIQTITELPQCASQFQMLSMYWLIQFSRQPCEVNTMNIFISWWENWGPGRLSDLPEVTRWVNSGVGIQTLTGWLQSARWQTQLVFHANTENPKGSRDNFTKPPRQMGYKFYHKRQMRRRWIYIGKGFRSSGSERVSMENPSRRQLDIASPSGCKLNSSHHLRLSLTSFVRNLGPFPLALGCASILLFK